jgi:segregation and condensation protein A
VGVQVSTPVFEGPFDLLLHLITKQQVDLWEVSLSSIVDAYVATLEQMQGLDLQVATEFLLIAAVLVELKARRLLPDEADADPEEELALWEERDLLLARLLECKTFKDAAQALSRLADSAGRSFPRTAGLEERFLGLAPDLLDGVTPKRLHDVMVRVLTPKPVPRVTLDHVTPVRTTVAEAVVELGAELERRGRCTFKDLTAGMDERMEVIVRFLAVLELTKRGLVAIDQLTNFADLHVTWLGADAADAAMASLVVEEYQG